MKFVRLGNVVINLDQVLYMERVKDVWWVIFGLDQDKLKLTDEEFNYIMNEINKQ